MVFSILIVIEGPPIEVHPMGKTLILNCGMYSYEIVVCTHKTMMEFDQTLFIIGSGQQD